jgi:hypothetical protein
MLATLVRPGRRLDPKCRIRPSDECTSPALHAQCLDVANSTTRLMGALWHSSRHPDGASSLSSHRRARPISRPSRSRRRAGGHRRRSRAGAATTGASDPDRLGCATAATTRTPTVVSATGDSCPTGSGGELLQGRGRPARRDQLQPRPDQAGELVRGAFARRLTPVGPPGNAVGLVASPCACDQPAVFWAPKRTDPVGD